MGRIQHARYDGLLRRLFSIKGGGSQLAETLGDAFPVIQLEGGPIELLRLAQWELGLVGVQRQSVVGQTLGVQLFNPAGSTKLVVPTTVYYTGAVDDSIFMGVTDVALVDSAVVGRQRDTREGVLARTVATLREEDAATVPVGAIKLGILAGEMLTLTDPNGLAVLAPGTGLTFVSVATNVIVQFGVLWRERVAEPSELNF